MSIEQKFVMTRLADILTPERTIQGVAIQSKKRALEFISQIVSDESTHLKALDIFESLVGRERLGSTGIGYGIAIPHCRIKGLTQVNSTLLLLPEGIDFDAIDSQPVDIIMALLVPEEATDEHLQLLATLADMFSAETFRQQLRASINSNELYQAFISYYGHK